MTSLDLNTEGLTPPPALLGPAGRWPPRSSSRPSTSSGTAQAPAWRGPPPPTGQERPATADRQPIPRSFTGLSPATIGAFGMNPRPAPPPPQRVPELSQQGQEAPQQGEEASGLSQQASRQPAPWRKISVPAISSFFSRKKKGKDKEKEDDIS
ncbi:hypothetical protein B0H67DRAFT_551036 [Lasiosphaeris hirsuta]|uniref:Uncharacterized protein n=1 Tax=Lasiosphaeris hirsuta TaxID=260670 RepID=A0AA40B0L3_9PEZI|nr:hypothetical protein B0H67DRAFT_551036 [Lasiosphaeris hirsuta]